MLAAEGGERPLLAPVRKVGGRSLVVGPASVSSEALSIYIESRRGFEHGNRAKNDVFLQNAPSAKRSVFFARYVSDRRAFWLLGKRNSE
jgi:hypothetical protein